MSTASDVDESKPAATSLTWAAAAVRRQRALEHGEQLELGAGASAGGAASGAAAGAPAAGAGVSAT